MFSSIDTGKSPARVTQRGTIVTIGCLSVAVDIQATETTLIADVSELYDPYPQEARETLPDFAVAMRCPSVWSTLFGKKIQAYLNGHTPF